MAKKQLIAEEIAQIATDLQNSKSEKRRSAAKKIGKNQLMQLGDELYNAYLKERKDPRTWETQNEMIVALGYIDYKKALSEMQEMLSNPKDGGATVNVAARTFVRLKRKNLNDVTPILELLTSTNPNIINGAIGVLTYDDMIPSNEDIQKIISIFDSKYQDDVFAPKGTTDPRSLLLSAMNKWNKSICEPYIKRFINSSDSYIKIDAEFALKGKSRRSE